MTFFPFGIVAKPMAATTNIQFIGATEDICGEGSCSTTPNVPTGVQEGDLLIVTGIVATGDFSSNPGMGDDGAWTHVANVQAGGSLVNLRVIVRYRFAGASESNPVGTFSQTGSFHVLSTFVSAYRGVDPGTPIEAFDTSESTNSSLLTFDPVIVTNEGSVLYFGCAANFAGGIGSISADFGEFVEREDGNNFLASLTTGDHHYVTGDEAFSGTGGTGTRSFTMSTSSSRFAGIMVVFNPES